MFGLVVASYPMFVVSAILGFLPNVHPELLHNAKELRINEFTSLQVLHANAMNLAFVGKCIAANKQTQQKGKVWEKRQEILAVLSLSEGLEEAATLQVLHTMGFRLHQLSELLPPLDWKSLVDSLQSLRPTKEQPLFQDFPTYCTKDHSLEIEDMGLDDVLRGA